MPSSMVLRPPIVERNEMHGVNSNNHMMGSYPDNGPALYNFHQQMQFGGYQPAPFI